MLRLFRSKIYLAIFLMTAVLLFGILGYRYISNYDWVDAIYMTIITVTTVGFSEVRPLDAQSKFFTISLIVSSVFIFAFAISVITEYVLGRNSLQILKKKKVKSKINSLTDHVIVCGYGRNGTQAAERLKAYKRPFVIIEKDKEIIERFEENILFIEGDANDDEILMEAGIDRAKFLITALPDDATNLFVVLSSRQLNKDLFIISRASLLNSQKKLMLAGANKVIMPDKIGGDHMASLVVMPDLITFMDKLSVEGGHTTNLEEVSIEDFTDQMECNSLRDLDLRRKTGCTIIGYISPEGDYIINPEADLQLQPKSKVIVLGRPEQIRKLNEMFHIV
ncbi:MULTISPECIES: potassium channel family protein [Cellulophaga]|jgi:voltage-gated potassium channel|uniref:Voltage-gated potassium channel n=2 Tax=Cellulophaga baltica TaxID=76594 RepID=A0A1G7KPS0_9FLAO|nr:MULTISPECIES: potassium channel protein [Cellulophaga]AIY13372.1 potassium transporter TrkA [Cellulophaga baltica NN016038]AIZ41728.1 potassium transporter TrkA [Cellulophaga baltica 18]KGK29494.1 potassium transporter TrkA [Cellulophaga sp. E6(2014)]MBA6316713.1 potassium channel protein [Cellulophaga baltica]MCR1026623.1 potassium channel protein [Cellulophaga baltica]